MADITMCSQKHCPNAAHCYRVQAPPSKWQAYAAFEYVAAIDGVLCDFYWPMAARSANGDDHAQRGENIGDIMNQQRHPGKGYRYWLYDPEGDGITYYRTKDDRDDAGRKAIASYLEPDGWGEAVEFVAAGEVTHIAHLDLVLRPQELDDDGCDDEGIYWGDTESMGNYTFEPLGPSAP